MSKLTQSPAWRALASHHSQMATAQMRDLFKQDPNRFDAFHLEFEDILLDFSKNRITSQTMNLLRDSV